ncbi:hypothetical protein ACFL5U_03350 [Candidatus Margulisiibacteriota bacterium]
MKTKKTLSLLLVTVMLVGLASGALGWGWGKDKEKKFDPEKKIEKLAKKLDLTEEQKAKILASQQAVEKDIEALFAKVKALRQKQQEELEKILTPEQLEKYQGMKKEWKGKKDKGKKGK